MTTQAELARQSDEDEIMGAVVMVLSARDHLTPRDESDLREAIREVLARAERRGKETALRPSWRP